MIDVPASYLLWLYDNWTYGADKTGVKQYLDDNLTVLKSQVKK